MAPIERQKHGPQDAASQFLDRFEGKPEALYSYLGAERQGGKLDNGLTVVLFRNPSKRIIFYAATVGGARHDPPELAGRAHFNEHMITSGTEDFPNPGELSAPIEYEGGSFNASTAEEFMGIDIEVLAAEDVPLAMRAISQCITKPVYRRETLSNERRAVIQEIVSRSSSNVSAYKKAFFAETPLETSVVGTKTALRRLTREDLIEHTDEMFVGRRMVLFVAGDIPFEDIMEQADDALGFLPKGTKLARSTTLPKIRRGDGIGINRIQETEDIIFDVGFRTSYLFHPDNAALGVLAHFLGGGDSSLLMRKLRYEKGTGLVYYAGTNVSSYSDAGTFTIDGSTSLDNLQRVFDITMGIIKDVKTNGLEEEEVEFAKNRMIKAALASFESSSTWIAGHQVSEMAALHSHRAVDPDAFIYPFSTYLEGFAKVTPGDIHRVANKYFQPDNLYVGLTGNVTRRDFKINF